MRIARPAGVVVLALLLSSCGWPQVGFDAGRSWSNPLEREIGASSVLRTSWAKGGPYAAYWQLVTDGDSVFGSYRSGIRALKERTGRIRWSAPPAVVLHGFAAPTTPVAVAADPSRGREVLIARAAGLGSASEHNEGSWGGLVSYDAQTGALLWSNPLDAVVSAAVADGRIFATTIHLERDVWTVDLVAVELTTGRELYRVHGLRGGVSVAAGHVFADSAAGPVSASATGCGAPVCPIEWTGQPWPGVTLVGNTTAATNRQLVVSAGAGLVAYPAGGCGASTCAPAWHVAGSFSHVAIDGPFVYAVGVVAGGDGVTRAYAFDTSHCTAQQCVPVWGSQETLRAGASTAPVVANGLVVFADPVAGIVAWRSQGCAATRCAAVWSILHPTSEGGQVLIADGRLYDGSDGLGTWVPT